MQTAFQSQFPNFKHRHLYGRGKTQKIRCLKEGKDLRVVQVLAGNKKPGSTERHRQTGLEELKAAVQKRHPLG